MVQFGALRDLARRELTDCLDKYSGKKVSIIIITIRRTLIYADFS